MNRFFSHIKQPYTSILICWGFLFGCILTVFMFESWQFYSGLVFLTILSRYFKPFFAVLLGFITSILVVLLHYQFFYVFDVQNISYKDEVYIEGQVTKVLSDDYAQVNLSRLNDQYFHDVFKPRANLAMPLSDFSISGNVLFSGYAKLRPFRGRKNFLNYDSELQAFKHKIIFKGKMPNPRFRSGGSQSISVLYREGVWSIFGQLNLGWLYYALLTGDGSKVSSDKRQMMRTLGLSHVMAISGLHIGIVFAIMLYLAKGLTYIWLRLFRPIRMQEYDLKVLYYSIGAVVAFAYVWLSGFSVSALRAYAMLMIGVLLYVTNTQLMNTRTLLIALTLVLFCDPFALLNPGLYFSFIAVAAIFMTVNQHKNITTPSIYTKLFLLVKIQLAISVMLAPLSMYYFQGVSLAGPVINLIAIPVLSFVIFPFMILGLAAGHFFNVQYLLAFIDNKVCWLLDQAISLGGWLKWWQSGAVELTTILVVYIVLLSLWFKFGRLYVWWPIGMYLCNKATLPAVWWQVDVFDVGHGTSVLISSEKKSLLYDLGAKYFDKYAIFEHVVQPYIRNNNLNLTYTILSHQDKDHVGGIDELYDFDNFQSLSAFHNGDPRSACRLKKINMGYVSIETLWPNGQIGSKNNNSCVVKVSDGQYSMLLPGDLEYKGEQLLISAESTGKLSSDILLVPHHGSKTSSSLNFLHAVNPKLAIYSRNFYSQWQLPHPEVADRYNKLEIQQLDTALDGHIKISIGPEGIDIVRARNEHSYWFMP